MTGLTRIWVILGVIVSLALILPGRTCSAAEEQKIHNLPSCHPLCVKYHVVFLLFLSNTTTESDFLKTKEFIEHEIHSCHECGATYHVEIYASGSNEWRTCCSQRDCMAQILTLNYSATIDSNVLVASRDVPLVDQDDQYRMNRTLSETITNAMPWTFQKYVFLVTDYGTNTVKEEQKRLNATASANRVIVRPFIIESKNFHKQEIMEYYQSLGALPMKNYDELVKSSETIKACQNQLRQAELKYPSECLGPILTRTSMTTSTTTSNITTTAYKPFHPEDQQPFKTTVAGSTYGTQMTNGNSFSSTSIRPSLTTQVQDPSDGPFSLDLYIFIALSVERTNLSYYEQVRNMTVELIKNGCDAQDNGSIFIFMPNKGIVCSWADSNSCIQQLTDAPFTAAQMNASDIMSEEQDKSFAPKVVYYVLKLLYEEDKNKHYVMLLLTDFVSIRLQDNSDFFTEVREQQNLKLEIIVVLDDINYTMSRKMVLDHYRNLTSDDLILTPPGFDNLSTLKPIDLSCSSAIAPPPSYPLTDNTTTSTTTTTTAVITKTQHKPNPDDFQMLIAILVSCGAGEENFKKIKDFVSNNVDNCMQRQDVPRPVEIYIYYPLEFFDGITFCHDSSCVNSVLDGMDFNTSCVPAFEISDTGRNDTETECAVRVGFTLLLEDGPKKNITNDNIPPPALLILSDYESIAFANVYESDQGFRTNISHLEFRLFVVNASIDYYKANSSIPNLYRFESYDAMVEKSTKLCPPLPASAIKTGLSTIAIAAISVAAVALLIIAVGIIFIVHYKNKHLDWRKKIMQFSNYGRSPSPSTTLEELPASSSSSVTHFNPSRRVSGLPVTFMEKRQSAVLSTIAAGRRKSGIIHPNWLESTQSPDRKIRTVSQQTGLGIVMETDLWEMARDQVIVKRDIKLGNGVYGEVFKGVIIGKAPIEQIYKTAFFAHQYEDSEVAVKMLHSYAEGHCRADFLQEIEFMKELGFHPNIANMLGCVTVTSPMCLILEYAYYGDMARFLRERKNRVSSAPTVMNLRQRAPSNDDTLSVKDLLSFAWQVSDGMEYLTHLGFVHRDLAARNVLVDKSMNAMISDFGLCRKADNVAYTSKAGRLPIKWMAIESLKSYQFSTKSDVWSFGVLMYEIFTMGMAPYIDIPQTEMIAFLSAGKRLQRPHLASSDIYDMMQTCWKERPADRPSFNALRDRLARHLEKATEDYGYLNMNLVPHGSRTSTFRDENV